MQGLFLSSSSLGTETSDKKEALVEQVLSHVLVKDKDSKLVESELRERSLEELELDLKVGKILLKNKPKGNLRRFSYLNLVVNTTDFLASNPEESQLYLEKFSSHFKNNMTLSEIKEIIKNIIEREPYFEDKKIFNLENGLKIQYRKSFKKVEFPDDFLADIDESDKKLMRDKAKYFLIFNRDNELIGFRSFIIMKDYIEGEAFVMRKSSRGKGLGKASFLKILEIWAKDPFIKRRSTVVVLGATEAGKGLIGSIIKSGIKSQKVEDTEYYRKVTFDMKELRRFFSR